MPSVSQADEGRSDSREGDLGVLGEHGRHDARDNVPGDEMRSYQWLTEDDMGWSWTHSLVWSVAVMSMNTFLVSRVILESAEERGTDQGGEM